MTTIITSVLIASIIELVNKIVYKKDGEVYQRTFYKSISGTKASIIRGILELGLIPDKAYTNLKAITKTLYRMFKSKKHLLEWTTAEEAEKSAKTDWLSYNKNMWFNLACGIALIIFAIFGMSAVSLIGSLKDISILLFEKRKYFTTKFRNTLDYYSYRNEIY